MNDSHLVVRADTLHEVLRVLGECQVKLAREAVNMIEADLQGLNSSGLTEEPNTEEPGQRH